jgi:hypothetical protein
MRLTTNPLLEYLLPSRRARMVGWYDPEVLARSAALLTIANLFGRHSDTRLIEALASQPQQEFTFTAAGRAALLVRLRQRHRRRLELRPSRSRTAFRAAS